MTLTSCQEAALQYVRDMEPGESVFLTGQAGTGKSYLLQIMQKEFPSITVASTGLAAIRVGGVTAHAMFGIPLGIYEPGQNPFLIRGSQREAISAAEYLFIDEVSMIRADVLDAISDACKYVRESKLRFGGLKVVMVGDALQLPPIVEREGGKVFEELYRSPWFFDAMCLTSDLAVFELSKVMRQKDFAFIHALNGLRIGRTDGLDLINSRVKEKQGNAIELVAYNRQADYVNNKNLDKLGSMPTCYVGVSSGNFKDHEFPVPKMLFLKVGARVVCMKNGKEHRNGDLGTIAELHDQACLVNLDRGGRAYVEEDTWEKATYSRDENGKLVRDVSGAYTQIPLRLGYAISVHKSQGQTYDSVHLDIAGKMFAPGQAYVALSRCKTLEGMTLSQELTEEDIFVDLRVMEFFNNANWVEVDE